MAEMTTNPAFWIDFEEARSAVETLVDLAHDEPDERPVCVILVGQSGMGKAGFSLPRRAATHRGRTSCRGARPRFGPTAGKRTLRI
jgi:hypothetical protein